MAEKKESKKVEKEDAKIKELKIQFLKSGSKRKSIKKELAKILTLQNKMKKENKK